MKTRALFTLLFAVAVLPLYAALPTGATLDPAAAASPVGNFPLAAVMAPDGRHLALLLCGWREQGVEIVDTASGSVIQKIPQAAAFVGIAFSPDGRLLATSGGNDDSIFLYDWHEGQARLAARIPLSNGDSRGKRYPAGVAFSPDGTRLYAVENLGDTIDVVDVAGRNVVQTLRTGRYPYAVASHGRDVWVSCWGSDEVERFTDAKGLLRRSRTVAAVRHPSALLLDPARHRLYAASASTDAIAVIDTSTARVIATIHDHPPQTMEGSTPNALALTPDGKLLVAEADNNAVAVIASNRVTGRIPTEWYPSALAVANGRVLVVAAKGRGTAPNSRRVQPGTTLPPKSSDYTLGQINGSVMTLPLDGISRQLAKWSSRVAAANGWNVKRNRSPYPPLRHVVYVIKENRTFDQLLGDLAGADGDPSLVFFGRDVTPNHHALAERFGILDRFFVNAEVSATGHNWSTAAYATDYTEKTVPAAYSSHDGRSYDYEGTNRDVVVDEDDDVAAPAAGYLWNAALRKGITMRDYGEFVATAKDLGDAKSDAVFPTRHALRGVTSTRFPGFDLSIPDQRRADIWLSDFREDVAKGTMPSLEIIRLPNDHTQGGKAGAPTPRAFVADNDLALGRIVEAISHSPFWKETVLFVLEDDAQDGPDHVDSHRSVLLAISPWTRGGVIHRFVNTTDVLATIEEILGLAPMSQFDAHGRPLRDIFQASPDLRAYDALRPAVSLDEKNPAGTAAARESALLDLSRPDAADDARLNAILWRIVKGDAAQPAPVRAPAGALVP